ncbi:MAG: DUF6498-containing protein [Planctomycetota bacterium]|jgi:hypothetical protein
MKLSKEDLLDIPVIALLAANTIPLWGVLFLDWDAFFIVLLYWAENLVIGFYNILKIVFVAVPHPLGHLSKLFLISFFTIHYGGFAAVHGFFILMIFSKSEGPPMAGEPWPCFFVFLQMLVNVVRQMYSVIPSQMKIAILALFISHGISFVYNYLLKREFVNANPGKLMSSPYSRVVVMHIAILAGGFLVMAVGSPAVLLIALVGLKTIFDVNLHNRTHRKAKAKT